MTTNASELVVGANGSVHVAPLGTPVPTDPTTAYDAAFKDLGFNTEAGVKLRDAKTMQEIKGWQSFYTIRRIITARDLLITFSLMQWNEDTVPLAFGGGTITATGGGVHKYTPPAPQTIDERMLGVDWVDGTKHYRLLVFRGMVTDAVETELTRQKESDLPIAFGLTADGVTDPWLLYTDDPAFS